MKQNLGETMSSFKNCINILTMTAIMFLSWPVVSATPINKNDPQQMLKDTTDQILELALATKTQTPPNSEAYYQQVDALLSQVIDLEYFTRGVMATYASARRYKSLGSEAEKTAFRARIDKFGVVLKNSLIRTYADALLTFDGERIEWEPAPPQEKDAEHQILTQIIHAASNKQYKVQYRLVKKSSGEWLVQNVIVEGLNMGETYRNQFADAVEKNKGDVDYVVDNWAQLMKPAKVPEQKP
jgi:phospholipid transport system substrate-binding protein